VTDVPLSELDGLARRFAGDRHDAYSERALARSFEEFVGRRRPPLAPFTLWVDGAEYPNFFAALADPNAKFASGEIRLDPAPAPGPVWEFLRPLERIVMRPDGSADLHPLVPGPPERAIARVLLREHYLPRSRSEEDRGATGGARVELAGFTGTFEQGVAACRQQSLLPLSVAVLLYFPEERVRYELDLVRSNLLADPRAGRLPIGRRVRRTSRVSWGVDRTVARGDLSLLTARCLEVLVESPGLTAVELAHVFGGVRELVDSALQGLVARQLVTFDRRTGVYRPRLEAFLPAPTVSATTGGTSSVANPALRTSVQELIAAADARATCPLCGKALPPGPRGILCESCEAEVNAT
jgi:hypothetical protein